MALSAILLLVQAVSALQTPALALLESKRAWAIVLEDDAFLLDGADFLPRAEALVLPTRSTH